MSLILRLLVVALSMALVGEVIYGTSLASRLKGMPREPISVGQQVERAIREPGKLTPVVDSILAIPLETPTPADRLPPPLPPSPKSAAKAAATPPLPPARSRPWPPAAARWCSGLTAFRSMASTSAAGSA